MPQEVQLAHRFVRDMALPYISNITPIEADPYYASGSADILTTIKGDAQRRPGFASGLEATPTVFNNLQRIFTWNRWDGTFIFMACDISAANKAVVYKMVSGTDAAFVSLFTSAGSAPFDFLVANNHVYFGNGTEVKKWNPVDGLSNWGITAPAAAPALNTDGKNAGSASGTNWTTPSNATGASDGAYAKYNATTQDNLFLTTYGFTSLIPGGATIAGIVANIVGHGVSTTAAQNQITIGLTLDGATVSGTAKTAVQLNQGTDTTVQVGGSGDLWGNASLTVAQVTATTFGVAIKDNDATASELDIDSVNLVVYYTVNNGVTLQVGWKYQACYGNSKSGHISSPSTTSNSTGLISNSSVGISLTASTDAQVDQIHVFRTTDGGGGFLFAITGSPFANTTQFVFDTTADTALNLFSIAPTPTFNDPPPLWQGMAYFQGRVWGFVNNRVWFSGLEEIPNGVPAESVPSGVAGNYWQFDEQVTALAATDEALVIFCPGRIYTIDGTSLDTFRRTLMARRRGCRNRAAVSALGTMIAWLDTANQVWMSDGRSVQELSVPIRPDLASVVQANSSLTFHVSNSAHWLVLSTGSKLFIYDMDKEQWMPPWTVAATYIYGGETAVGTYDLMAAISKKALKLSKTAHNDNGAAYPWTLVTNLFNLVPDFGRRFSYIAVGIYDEPSRTGKPWYVAIERSNASAVSTMSVLFDEDPTNTNAPWVDITANATSVSQAFHRQIGTYLLQDTWALYKLAARRMAVKIVGLTTDVADDIYSMFIAYQEFR